MNIIVGLQKCGIFLTKVIPLYIADKIGRFSGGLCYVFLKKRRQYILKNLYYILPNNPELHNTLCRRTFENFARCMVDFFRLGHLTKEEIIKSVLARGKEYLNKALEYNRGCILITLHLGNWDYAGSYLAASNFPMNALAEETEPEMFRLYTEHREATGLKTFSLSRATLAFLDAIKNNRILAVIADRDIPKQGKVFKFFSGKRSLPSNLAGIVVKRKIPVVFGYTVLFNKNVGDYRYLVVIEPVQMFDSEEDFNKYIVERFEEVIAKYPDQWFVFHPEWIE